MHWTKWSGCDWLVFGNLSSDILIILLPGLQMVRGALTLPHGTGKVWWYTFWILLSLSCVFCTEFFCLFFKTVRVAVFAEGPAADEARAAGADVVGGDELIEEIRKGTLIHSVAVPYRSLSIYMHVFLCTVSHVFEDVHELERLLFFFSYHSTFFELSTKHSFFCENHSYHSFICLYLVQCLIVLVSYSYLLISDPLVSIINI